MFPSSLPFSLSSAASSKANRDPIHFCQRCYNIATRGNLGRESASNTALMLGREVQIFQQPIKARSC